MLRKVYLADYFSCEQLRQINCSIRNPLIIKSCKSY